MNASDLQSLYEKLTEDPEIGEDLARFVIAYRLFGPIDQESDQDDLSERANGEDELSSDRPANEQAGQPESNANPGTEESRSTDVTIAGLDASGGPAFDIASALDLIDVSVAAATTSGDGLELPSPLTTAPGGVDLDHWLDRTTTVQGGGSLGPVNVNTAPREVLMAVPQMREEMAASILAGRTRRRVEREPFDAGLAWLLVDGALTVEQLKSLEPYLTGHSQVFRMQVIGYSEDGKAVARVRSIVDLSGSAAMVVSQRDLSSLGHGYSIRSLFGR